MAYKETVIEFKAYNVTGELPVDNNTNSLLVINKGTAVAYINGLPLQPSESWGDSRNAGEVITGKFLVTFAPGAAQADCLMHVQLTRYK